MNSDVGNYLASVGISDSDIQHYGKKGMKWGVRNDDSPSSYSSGGGEKAPKMSKREVREARDTQVLDARARNRDRQQKLDEAIFESYSATGAKASARAEAKLSKIQKEAFEHPDYEMASRMTSGERTVMAFSYGLYAVPALMLDKKRWQPRPEGKK